MLAGDSSVQGAADAPDNEGEDVMMKIKVVLVRENKVTRKGIILNSSLELSTIKYTPNPQLKTIYSLYSLLTAGTTLAQATSISCCFSYNVLLNGPLASFPFSLPTVYAPH